MNGCVVDFEAYRGDDRQFIVKELAIVDVQHGLSRVILFKSPFDRACLNRKSQRIADWLEHNLHGISWTEGEVDYTHLHKIIYDVCQMYSVVFTKGLEKARFLSALHTNVRDLNDECAPKYDDAFCDPFFRCNVRNHNYTDTDNGNKYVYKCALRKASYFAMWLRNK